MSLMTHKQSKFVLNALTLEVVSGKLPTQDGQLFKGETADGRKMEAVGAQLGPDFEHTFYHGWST